MFSGMTIHEVEPGTEISRKGEKLTVTDIQAVVDGRNIYVTPKVYAALASHTSGRAAPK